MSIEHNKILIHTAKLITDWNGTIFKNEVLKEVGVDSIVRISMVMPDPPINLWSHDAPYVSIVEIDKENMILGEVLDIGRDVECNRYPIASGDRLWFSLDNIIEIPLKDQGKNKAKKMRQYLTAEKVTVTGPLYTIVEDNLFERDSSNSHSYESYSDEEIDNDMDTIVSTSYQL